MSTAVALLSDHLQHGLAGGQGRGGERPVYGAAWRCRRSLAALVVSSRRSTRTGVSSSISIAVRTHSRRLSRQSCELPAGTMTCRRSADDTQNYTLALSIVLHTRQRISSLYADSVNTLPYFAVERYSAVMTDSKTRPSAGGHAAAYGS